MRILLGVLLLIVCTYLGYLMSTKFSKRKVFFNSFCEFNSIIRSEIQFTQSTIPETIKSYGKTNDFIFAIKNHFNNKDNDVEYKYLSIDEIEYFNNYLKNLGNGDKTSQEKFLESVSRHVEEKLKTAREEEKEFRTLYVKLGFLLGLIALTICL